MISLFMKGERAIQSNHPNEISLWFQFNIPVEKYNSLPLLSFIISLAVPVGNMKRILCSDWLSSPSCPLKIAHFDPARERKLLEVNLQKGSYFFDSVCDGVAKSIKNSQIKKA